MASKSQKSTAKFANPYRAGTCYAAIVDVLSSRIGKPFTADQLIAAMPADIVKALKGREARNEETGKDWKAKVVQNAHVLRRVKDYGKPVIEAGAHIAYDKAAKTFALMLGAAPKAPAVSNANGKEKTARKAK